MKPLPPNKLQSPNPTPPPARPPRGQTPGPPAAAPTSTWLKQATDALHRLESGRTGDAWDVVAAPSLHAKHPIADALLKQMNANLGAAAFTVNLASNTAGHLLADLPAWAEEQWTARGGPSFDETALLLRSVTPGLPWDDLTCYGLARWTELARRARYRVLRPEIAVTADGLSHTWERHMAWQPLRKSMFLPGLDAQWLVQEARKVAPSRQRGGNLERIVDAGRIIGIDRNGMKPTSIYSVITDACDNLITTFPGNP